VATPRAGRRGRAPLRSLARAIAALHHGSIEVAEPMHAGARLVLRLPAALDADGQQASSTA
jgi:hypothetical protein